MGLVSPARRRHHGALWRGGAGPHALFTGVAGGPGARLRGEAAAEEEVEGAHEGGVGADDADVDFGAGGEGISGVKE